MARFSLLLVLTHCLRLWKSLDFRRESLILAIWYCADLKMQMNLASVAAMVNHIPKYKTLVVLAERERHDLREELNRFPCVRVSINGTPDNLAALSDHPEIKEVSLRSCDLLDFSALLGLSRLRRLDVAFGPLSSLELSFCSSTLEFLALSRLRQLKDLSTLPLLPNLERLAVTHIHAFAPPDFRMFPNLRQLSIWNTDWQSLNWLVHLPHLETLHISQIKVEDKDWKPILGLKRLRHLHGMQNVFRSSARKEFVQLRPDVRVDQGIPVDLEKHPQTKEFLEELSEKRTAK